jgi:putative alpha-1,2-mannosidase
VLDSAHIKQQVSRTLEYSYDDYVISQLALLYSAVKGKESVYNDSLSNIFGNSVDFVMTEIVEGDGIIGDFSLIYKLYLTVCNDDDFFAILITIMMKITIPILSILLIMTEIVEGEGLKQKRSSTVAARLLESSQNYRWLIDTDGKEEKYKQGENINHINLGYIRPRYANYSWGEDKATFDEAKYYTWLTETNVWQYSFSVLHDVEGLIQASGGDLIITINCISHSLL